MLSIHSKSHKSYLIGEIIITSEPIVHVINGDFKGKCCDNCLSVNDLTQPLKKCTKCKLMFYCDRRCQKIDWRVHRLECHYYKRFGKQFISDRFDRLLIRLWLLTQLNPNLNTKCYQLANGNQISLNNIKSNYKDISLDDKRLFDSICIRFKSFGITFDNKLLFDLFCKVSRFVIDCETIAIDKQNDKNRMNRTEADLADIKFWALYIPVSIFNHSCSPNACKVFVGKRIELRAIKPIDVNQEITISYVFLEKSKTERQKALKNRFFGDCQCMKCSTNFDETIDYKRLRSLESQRMKDMNELYLKPIKNYANQKELDSIEEELMTIYRKIYGKYDPNLTVEYTQYFNWKFLSQSETKQTMDFLKKYILKIILITHGFNHPLFINFVKLIKFQDLIENKS